MKYHAPSSSLLRHAFRAFGIVALAAGLLQPLLRAQRSATGSIEGQVVNQATNAPLEGAIVVSASDPRIRALTASDGTFRLTNVPAGAHTLVVDYTGLDTARVPVVAASNERNTVRIELGSKVYRLDKYTVSAVREGQAKAINQQRMAENVRNVVATDAFGNVADTNVANLLVKLPGITPVYSESVAFRVRIRGVDPSLNSVAVDGTLLAGATTRGTNRGFEIDKVSTNSIESIDVVKSPTPDMDADAIGGAINLRTKSAFDRPKRDIQYSLAANLFPKRTEETYPSASVVYSDIFGADQRIGLVLTGSYNRRSAPRFVFRTDWLNPTLDRPAVMSTFQITDDDIRLDRTGLGAKLSFKLNSHTTLFVNSMYNGFEDLMRQRKQWIRANTAAVSEFNDNITQFSNGQIEYEMEGRTRTVNTWMVQAGGKTDWNGYLLDYDISHSRSYGLELREDLDLRMNGVGYRIDRTRSNDFPTYTQTSGGDIRNYDNYFTQNLGAQNFQAWDRVTGAQFNVKRGLNTALPIHLKAGFRYRGQEKRQKRRQPSWIYVGPDGIAGPVNGRSDDNLNRFQDDGHHYAPLLGKYPWPSWPDWFAMHEERRVRGALFRYNEDVSLTNALQNNHVAREDIYSYYFMGDVKTGRLTTLAGVRVERTDTSGTSPVQNLNARTVLERWANSKTVKGGYTNTFPGLHLRYEATPKLLLRASASTSIGRPQFTQLIPTAQIDVSNGIVTQNNPSLRPQFSKNYDISAEYYFQSVGLVSVSAFRKDMKGFSFTTRDVIGSGPTNGFDGQYAGFVLNTRGNGGWARINGVEFNYSQQLTFLPGMFNAFGIYGNCTVMDTEGTYATAIVTKDIAGFVKRTGNVGLSYIKHGFTVRTSLTYVGHYMVSFNADPARAVFDATRSSVDFSVKYAFRPKVSFFADATNIFNANDTQYIGLRHRPTFTQFYGVHMTAGISGSF